MTEKRSDWRSGLAAVVELRRRDLGPHPGPDELVAYHAGELGERHAARLQDHLVLCPECAQLLLDLAAFEADAARAPGGTAVPIAPHRAARPRRWAMAAAAAAAAVALVAVWPRPAPLPDYAPPVLTGAASRIRAADAATAGEVPLFVAGSTLALRLRPETAVEGPVTARAYLRRGADLRALSASTLEVRGDGVVSLEGILDADVRLPEGASDLLTVVARPGALPSRRRLAGAPGAGATWRGRSWIAFRQEVSYQEPEDRTPKSAWAADDDGPWVEYAGCRTITIGPVCHLRDDRRLTLWVRHRRQADVRIVDAGGSRSSPAAEVQGGLRYEIEVGRERRELAVEVLQEGTRRIWTLELDDTPPPDWLVEARELYDGGEWDEARRALAPRAAGPDPAAAGAALSLLARIERRAGQAELGDEHYRRAIEAHRRAGRLFDQIRDAAGYTYHLVAEKRFSEARELLDSLPVEATAGAAESRYSVAYARGLLVEKTGDFRAALAWMNRAAREAERAGSNRNHIFAEATLARQLYTVGLTDSAADRYSRIEPRIARLCAGAEADAVLTACDCARFRVNRAWTALLALEAGRPARDDPAALLAEAERIYVDEEARGEGTCVLPENLPNLRLNRALAALHAGDPEEARRQLERADVDPEASPRLALWQLDVEARIWLADERPERALDLYHELARRAELGSAPEAAWRAAYGRAAALEALGRTDDALAACAAADQVLDRESLLVPVHAGRARFIAQRDKATRFCLDLLLRRGRDGEALAVARRAAARALGQLRASASLAALGAQARGRWERAADTYRDTRNEIEELTARTWKGLPRDQEQRLYEEIEGKRRELRALIDELAAAADGAPPESGRPAPPAAATVLLAYHPLPRGWVAFAADDEGVSARRVDLPRVRSAEELSALLLEPFAAKIRRAEEVQVIAYGSLREVDFHALPFAGDVLLSHAPVVYRLDLPDLPAAAPPPDRQALVVSGPGLIAAPDEARKVRGVLESRSAGWQVELLAGAEASESDVRRRLPEVSLLHFAGHAAFDDDSRGWDSHLSLAGGGRLTVDDVLASPRVPRWVVLSGCQTGRQERTAPLATIGLAQAFLVAGADSVVAVTADVADADAAALSEALYRYWDASTTLAAALRQAQLELRARAPESGWRKFRALVR